MNQDIVSQLKSLKRITPHASFAARSKAELFALTQPRVVIAPWFSLRFAGAVAFTLVLLLGAAAFAFPPRPTLSASLNEGLLTQEFNALPINIELDELTYREATKQTVASTIGEIQETEAAHLNASVIESELSSLEAESTSSKIDSLLDEVLQ